MKQLLLWRMGKLARGLLLINLYSSVECLTQRRREAENAERISNVDFYGSEKKNLLFKTLGDVLLKVN